MKRQRMRPPAAGERQTRYARLLGLAFCMAGFAAIALGWAGAARKACVDCQIPYLISGGAAGVALVVFGAGLLLMAQMRTEARRLSGRLEYMTRALTKNVGGVPATSANGKVVAGRSTFHLPDCRLVKDKPGLDLVTVEAAVNDGLDPCRICDPLHWGPTAEDTRVDEPLQTERPATVGADARTEQIDVPPQIGTERQQKSEREEPGAETTSWWKR
ncbi:MAG: hypothetical protein ACRDHO_14045 [Actinomycetota bacterium]